MHFMQIFRVCMIAQLLSNILTHIIVVYLRCCAQNCIEKLNILLGFDKVVKLLIEKGADVDDEE